MHDAVAIALVLACGGAAAAPGGAGRASRGIVLRVGREASLVVLVARSCGARLEVRRERTACERARVG